MKAVLRREGLHAPGRLPLELRLAIEHAVSGILQQSANIEEAAPRVIRAVCEQLPWLCYGRWRPEGEAENAPPQGLYSALLVPVGPEERPAGVMQFFSREAQMPDAELLDCMVYLHRQIGQFIERTRAEEERRRFRAAMDVSAELILLVDPERIRYVDANETACRTLGYSREELLGLGPHNIFSASREELASAYQRLIAGDPGPAATEGWYLRKDGSRVLVESFRRVLQLPRGHLIVAVARDIGERKRQQMLLELEHTVTRCLAEADDAGQALKSVMRAVCHANEWECGRYFTRDPATGNFVFQEAWHDDVDAVNRFVEWSRQRSYAPGLGLVGRVGESGQPLWVPDASADPRVAHPTLATEFGMRGVFMFPVMTQGTALGVLSFTSREIREPDERLLMAVQVIGSQIGQFLQRKKAEEVTRESEERFRSLTLLSSDIYWEQDEQFRFTQFAGTMPPRIKQGQANIIGRTRWEQDYVNMNAQDWATHIELLRAHKPFRDFELCRLDGQGQKIWVSVSGEPVFDDAGRFKGYRGVGRDITARKLDEEHIHHLANHDALTALPNRFMFSRIVSHAIQGARRHHRGFALLFVDLDRFKLINDALGHEAGDALLKEMAQRLAQTIRASDVVSRLGGDEFVVLIQEVAEASQAEVVARKVLAALMRPVAIGEHEYRITASVGIAIYPNDGHDEQTLMKNADIAMYGAKEDGKNTFHFYSAAANVHSFERLTLEAGLRRGLEENQFLLHYQPKVNVASGAITGMEALVRWQHPQLGMVPPGQFIPLAEESGLVVPLGKWVLRTACAQNMAWQREGLPALRMSVNISARQFADPELLKDIADALTETGLRPELLELELTESMVMRNPERALGVLEAVKDMGVRLAIDDFGVGYSSLAHLKRFPIDTLKIDRSFIRDIPQDPEDKAIAEAIIAMGRSLGLTLVAEGVETAEQHAFLREHGCGEMQGYYFSKPLPADAAAQLLRKPSAG